MSLYYDVFKDDVRAGRPIDFGFVTYVPERTCRMTDARWDNGQCTWGCICSACDAHLEHERGRYLNYCPRCGARVEMSFAELLRCSYDAERPRPRCPGCGRPAKIGRAKRYNKATREGEEA